MRILYILFTLAFVSATHADVNTRVVDGDTLKVNGITYRLHGIDAPEASQLCDLPKGEKWACGQKSTEELQDLIAGQTVRCEDRGQDIYGRILAACWAGKQEINAHMVNVGLAWAFRKYSLDYVEHEDSAREAAIGIWQFETETAWDFRAQKWNVSVNSGDNGDCPIKGNINRKNERIYHVPWSKDYNKTKIDASKGEKWFCSEAEAIAAGWRAPFWGSQ
ncbi:thermonuclease family protein [Agrobacterium sp. rho-13.3]|uniref:thermonuclease family protein n=1 Tax=Agrobacterium sp. rho-13.3 TaxID=3072980 RepID=UPI002A154906|nr:thermonuclease family protein [Agrobacterium sp. rho-13.3]MDX8306202.1 thermonuclease family protein [Agrobacterium sp. rho-13.3]MDX8307467.1 thermonuclease family protein [Agrobacterium sp. rho-13.3]